MKSNNLCADIEQYENLFILFYQVINFRIFERWRAFKTTQN